MITIDSNYEKLKAHLESILDKDLYTKKIVKICPHCSSNSFIKYGNYKNGQRYLCKNCNRTFCKRTNTTFYRSKKSAILWSKYIELLLSKTTLKECSKVLKISLGTAFFWRHKILRTLSEANEPNNLDDLINIMKIFTKENYKGSRSTPSKKREKVWTILATDTTQSILARPIGIGGWNKTNFDRMIYSKISSNSYMNSFLDSYLNRIAINHNNGKKNRSCIIYETSLVDHVQEIRSSLKKFNGVATKYLIHYLYLSTLFSSKKRYDAISLIYKLSNINNYIMNNDLKYLKPLAD